MSLNEKAGYGNFSSYRNWWNTIKASKIEFQFADLDILTNEEYDFLGHIIYEAETIPAVSEKSLSTTNRGKI